MPYFSEAFNADITPGYSKSLCDLELTGSSATAHAIPFATMILDSLGTVRYCHADAARLFDASANTLVGRPVRDLIADLPFNSKTPGYNIAYASFWAPRIFRNWEA